jgi:hypothetical protein
MEKIITHQQYSGYGDWIYGPNDDRPDNTPDDLPTIVEKARELGPINAALANKSADVDVSRDWLIVSSDDIDDNTGQLDTGLAIVKTAPASSSTLGKRARPGIAKTVARTDEDGFRWIESYDATGALLDTRVLLSDTEE